MVEGGRVYVVMLLLLVVVVAAAASVVTVAVLNTRRAQPPSPGLPADPSRQPFPVYDPTNFLSPGDRERILILLRRGKKIHAVKLYREVTGSGLKEAKDAVDHLERFQ